MADYLTISSQNQKKAFEIIKELNIEKLWKSIGARINLVGSLKMGLLAKHRDIDFHIYTKGLDITQSFLVMSQLATHPKIKKIEYTNLINTEEHCIEWHALYEDDEKNIWQLDLIHILEGSTYDGYFEKVAENISSQLTAETRNTILRLKYETPENEKIMGIEYYKAVIQNNITNFEDFQNWRKAQNLSGIIEW